MVEKCILKNNRFWAVNFLLKKRTFFKIQDKLRNPFYRKGERDKNMPFLTRCFSLFDFSYAIILSTP
jgi:hypothetical protein